MTDHTGRDAITDVHGIKVGHWTDKRAATGCTVVLCPLDGAVGGVDVRGGAPGTRETDLLRSGHLVDKVHGVLLSGGSAFGLDAAGGVLRFLEEKGVGLEFGEQRIPIVPAAILFDLGIGRADRRPDAESGYRAAKAAKRGAVAQGSVGAGTGATVAKAGGADRRLKGGLGTSCEKGVDGLLAGALAAVNAGGDIIDPGRGAVIAGPRGEEAGEFLNGWELVRDGVESQAGNTTLAVVATNANLTKEQANRLASVAQDGFARTIRPAHGMHDGDTVFVLATGEREVDEISYRALEAIAVRAVERAIIRGVLCATGLAGVPSAREWAAQVME
ncbi:MAG: P1 family peptidase [Chloroflexi bacterium]|nr:P1 family peptidase [Chloroflexota bacterium]MCI0890079.1 P1 family peptidase [Chloroflexota bacterium]